MEVISHVAYSGHNFFGRWCWLCYVFLLLMDLLKSSSALVTISSTNGSDRLALLAFKSQLLDPLDVLRSWNDSIRYCQWRGVTCGHRHRDRVTMLNLQSQKLEGTLSPFIGNLTFLRVIALTNNSFKGEIPQEIGRLFRLQQLYLSNNSFIGEIPINLTRCSNLIIINLIDNKLHGNIPAELSYLRKLQGLGLGKNDITGHIPPSLGNLSSLFQLSVLLSHLEGSIPDNLCQVSHLRYFNVGGNNLTGEVPSCLYNNSNLKVFGVSDNKLEGRLPPNIGLSLPNVWGLSMGRNKFKGIIPVSLSNATSLEFIDFGLNNFTGSVPADLGRLSSGLRGVYLGRNQLGTKVGDDLKFLTSLTNCSNLEIIDIGVNYFGGPLPDSISNLSITLEVLSLKNNNIYGSFPVGIDNLVNLKMLILDNINLIGNIPPIIGKLNRLSYFFAKGNMLSGQIPTSLGNLTQLRRLVLSGNSLSGIIPPTLGNCQNLDYLDLSQNNLNGTIPKEVIVLSSLTILLDFAENSFTGSLPSQVGNLTNLMVLSISGNRLSGHVPNSLGYCLNLISLDLHNNIFEGEIPKSLISLRGLEELDLSRNNLSGEIPEYFEQFTLSNLNLSFNQFEGRVPKNGVFGNASLFSLVGNKNLCGGILELKLPPCIQKETKKTSFHVKVIVPIIVGSLCLLMLSCAFLVCYRRAKAMNGPSSKATLFDQFYERISYVELLKATNGFSSDNLLGVGSYGSVFKGVIQDMNRVIAVKVLNLQREGAPKSFLTESNALRNLRHRNLLKIITSCSSVDFKGNDFKALVFEFMSNGSLEEWLHPRVDEQRLHHKSLNFTQGLNIAIDVACALEYLHHYCQPGIVHRDMKPSNVLLDDAMIAHVADFGIAKMFSATSSDSSQPQISSVIVKGTIGYVAPEYGMGGEASTEGDVYSFGILLLEIFTRKKPTDDMFSDGLTLHNYVQMALHNQDAEILGPMMLLEENADEIQVEDESHTQERLQECLISVIRLGLACSMESPVERMTIKDAITELHHIKDHHQGARINESMSYYDKHFLM